MKKIFITIALLSSILLIMPKFIGGVVETEYQLALKKLNENPAITIKSTTFNGSWYSGQAVTEMALLLQDGGIDDINITIEDELSFGPIIFTDDGLKLGLSYSKSAINFTDLLIGAEVENFIKNKIHVSTLLTLSKDINTHITIDEVSKEVDGNNIVSAKAVGNFVLESDNRFYGDFNWAGLTATKGDENFIIENVKLTLDQKLIAGSFYQGNAISTGYADFSISALNAKGTAGEPDFLLNNLLIKIVSSAQSDLLKIKMNYNVDQLVLAEQQLKHANLAIALNGLNISAMQEVNALLAELSGTEQDVFSSDNMNKLSGLITKLLAHDPTINIEELSVETPEGKIESNMKISADKQLFDSANFMSIMTATNATAGVKAPMAFFTKLGLAPMVQHYIEQGFIIKKADQLSVNVNFMQGQLNVNGNPIQL